MNLRTNQSLERYLQEIGEVPLLTAEQEIELAKQIRLGGRVGQRALDTLTKANLRFVVSVAKQYQNQGLSLNDLINEGNLGLIKAAQRFDETRGFKFISYAVWWIRQSILQALAEQSRVVRLPLNRVGAINKIQKKYSELEQLQEREPTAEEIAEALQMSPTEVNETLQMNGRHLSMDAPFAQGEDNRLLDIVPDETSTPPDSGLVRESLEKEIERALATLTEREADVIRWYFGLHKKKKISGIDGEELETHEPALTLEEIGEKLKLTRERVRQIKEKAIRRLRHQSRSSNLRPFLG
ncbi:MAG: sigma-70 family RNA polymerase sigma factor [bacterium]|nr:sigma-70 family RNA polymerase sigma factor [bacterium]